MTRNIGSHPEIWGAIDELQRRVEGLEQKLLVQKPLGPPRNSPSPYDLGAIARQHQRRIAKNGR